MKHLHQTAVEIEEMFRVGKRSPSARPSSLYASFGKFAAARLNGKYYTAAQCGNFLTFSNATGTFFDVQAIDFNNDGEISQIEFIKALRKVCIHTSRSFDTHRSGKMSQLSGVDA